MEPRKDRESGGWELGDLISGLFDGIDLVEGAIWVVRAVGHVLFAAGRVVFHLLTCHF